MPTKKEIKWRSILGLFLLYFALWQDWQWIWSVLFFSWAISNIISQNTYFVETIEKKHHPILYWTIILTWILLGIYSLLPYAYFL